MHRFRWEIRRLAREAGWPGAAGLALAVLGIGLHVEGVAPLRGQIAEVRQDADELRRKVAARRATAKDADPAEQLAEFYAFFPDGDAMADTIERLQAAAAQENLILEQGEYRLAREQAGQLSRYDIVLPMKGPYSHVRRFVAAALRENPSLALEGVSLNRQAAITIGVDAQVRMTLYFREAK